MSEDNFFDLINELKTSAENCWSAKVALHEQGVKYSHLCIKVLLESRQIPKLINNRIEKRKQETGLDVVHPDFWDADMIIALSEHYQKVCSEWIEEAQNKSKDLVTSRSI